MSGKSKVKKAEVYRWLSQDINAGKLGSRYYVTEPEPGKKEVLKNIGENVVMFVDQLDVVNNLISYIDRAELGGAYQLTHREAVECVKFWAAITPSVSMPVYLAEKNDPKMCFQRLSFNYADMPKETLVIDEFMSRCSNASAIRQFIGSLTVENSPRFQYVYIFGSGGEGKGSFARGLNDVFGIGVVTMPVPKTDSQKQFMAYSLQGKRLCIFPECSNFNFPADPLFKQFTGGDHVWIEQKGKSGYSSPINCKFIFLSNDRPGVSGNDANLRRMIYSEISKPTVKYTPGVYDSLIRAEMPSFIIKCRREYLDNCPNNETIEISDDKTKELIDQNEEQWQVLTEKWFERDAEGFVTPARLQEIKSIEKLNGYEYRQWLEYMRSRVGIESSSDRSRDKRKTSRVWRGIRDKTDKETASWVMDKNNVTPISRDVTRVVTRRNP